MALAENNNEPNMTAGIEATSFVSASSGQLLDRRPRSGINRANSTYDFNSNNYDNLLLKFKKKI